MPTEPILEIIPRTIEEPKLSKTLTQFSSLIEETVNFGSHVFNWCFSVAKGREENIPIFLSFRHIFELIDSISLLVRESCIEPCKMLLRAIFESTLSIEYILEENTKERGMDFMISYYHDELKFYRRWDPDDPMCLEFRKKTKTDKVLKDWSMQEFPNVKEEIQKRIKILELPNNRESEKEYQRTKKRLGRVSNWFSLHNGPGNIEKLAEHLNRPGFYQMLYRHWSPAVHGTDIIREKVSLDKSGRVYVHQLRLPTNAQAITFCTTSFALTNIRHLNNHFYPEKKRDVSRWYQKEIKDLYLGLAEKNIIEVR